MALPQNIEILLGGNEHRSIETNEKGQRSEPQHQEAESLGHTIRGEKYPLLQNIIQGKITGKLSIGRRRHSWVRNIRDW